MTYFTLPTNAGLSELAAAQLAGQTVPFTHIALGDGNGAAVVPDATQNALVHEVCRVDISSISADPAHPSWLIFEAVVPEDVGGWTAREVALIGGRVPGLVMAVGNYPATEKTLLADGAGRALVVRMVVAYVNAAAVNLSINPQAYATEQSVLQAVASHEDRTDPHPQYLQSADVEILIEARSGNYALDTGNIANAYVIALSPTITGYTDGMTVRFRTSRANTAATTLDAGGGAVPLQREDGVALSDGDITSNAITVATYVASAGAFLVNEIVRSQLGALAKEDIGLGLQDDGSGNLQIKLADTSLNLTDAGLQVSLPNNPFFYFMGQL